MRKVYLFANFREGNQAPIEGGVCISISDAGDVLGSHFCSHAGWMRHDLTGTPSRKKHLEEYFGGPEDAAYEVMDCGHTLPPWEVASKAFDITQEQYEKARSK